MIRQTSNKVLLTSKALNFYRNIPCQHIKTANITSSINGKFYHHSYFPIAIMACSIFNYQQQVQLTLPSNEIKLEILSSQNQHYVINAIDKIVQIFGVLKTSNQPSQLLLNFEKNIRNTTLERIKDNNMFWDKHFRDKRQNQYNINEKRKDSREKNQINSQLKLKQQSIQSTPVTSVEQKVEVIISNYEETI